MPCMLRARLPQMDAREERVVSASEACGLIRPDDSGRFEQMTECRYEKSARQQH